MDTTVEMIQNKKLDVQMLAKVLNQLSEGDKRQLIGYIKCMCFSTRAPTLPETVSHDR